MKIWLDAGHGGHDSGAVGGGYKEKDLALDVTLRVGKLLSKKGQEVLYTRTDDTFVTISGGNKSDNRMTRANSSNADICVSIHLNAVDNTKVYGLETFYYPGSIEGRKLSDTIYEEMIKNNLYTNRNDGVNALRGSKAKNLAMTRVTKMPSTLIELMFISNQYDRELLLNNKDKFAESIANGILKYLGISNTQDNNKQGLTREEFIEKVASEIVGTKTDIMKSVTIAQAIHESNWGKSYLAQSANNLFGIKASDDWQGDYVETKTKEQDKNGKETTILAKFRKYDSYKDSILDHDKFFTSTPWRTKNYKRVLEAKSYEEQTKALQECGYATDVCYADKLMNKIEQYYLQRFDKVEEVQSKKVYRNMYILSEKVKAVSVENGVSGLWLKKSKVYVPIREFFETLGLKVDYRDETIYIEKEKK